MLDPHGSGDDRDPAVEAHPGNIERRQIERRRELKTGIGDQRIWDVLARGELRLVGERLGRHADDVRSTERRARRGGRETRTTAACSPSLPESHPSRPAAAPRAARSRVDVEDERSRRGAAEVERGRPSTEAKAPARLARQVVRRAVVLGDGQVGRQDPRVERGHDPWQRLNLWPEPHGQGSLRPTWRRRSGPRATAAPRRVSSGRRSRGPSGLPPGLAPGRGRGSGRARPARAARRAAAGLPRRGPGRPGAPSIPPASGRRRSPGRRSATARRARSGPTARAPRHPGRRQAASRRPVSRRRSRRAPPSRQRAPPGATPPIPSRSSRPCPQVTPARPCAPPTPRGPARRGSAAGRGRRRGGREARAIRSYSPWREIPRRRAAAAFDHPVATRASTTASDPSSRRGSMRSPARTSRAIPPSAPSSEPCRTAGPAAAATRHARSAPASASRTCHGSAAARVVADRRHVAPDEVAGQRRRVEVAAHREQRPRPVDQRVEPHPLEPGEAAAPVERPQRRPREIHADRARPPEDVGARSRPALGEALEQPRPLGRRHLLLRRLGGHRHREQERRLVDRQQVELVSAARQDVQARGGVDGP